MNKEMKFEEALKKLEEIVQGLEGEELSLDDSLKKFEEGIRLSQICRKKLEEIEKKVQMLTKVKEGELKAEPFNPPEDEH